MHRTIRFIAIALCLAAAMSASQAQSIAATDTPPLLDTGPQAPAVELQNVVADTIVVGGLAQTTVELEFHNPSQRVLEGQLSFPLREGQRITGFALDIEGRMRDAVPVPKAKGRVVFEEIERRGVDPGLLEQTAGNHFRLRIYPIPAQGSRRVRLTYSEDLGLHEGQYRLPVSLAFARGARDLNVSLRVEGGEAAPQAEGTLARGLAFTHRAMGWEAGFSRGRFSGQGTLALRIPRAAGPRVYTQHFGDDIYFLAEQPVGQAGAQAAPRRALPQSLAVVWDASASARERNREAELTVLSRYLAQVGEAKVSLTLLRDVAEPTQVFSVHGGDASTLIAALRSAVYDGGSQLTGWAPSAGVQEILFFTDGLDNYGAQRDLPVLPAGATLYTLHAAGAHADNTRLRHWAQARGGRLIAIDAANPEQALAELTLIGPRLLEVELAGGDSWTAQSYLPREGVLRVAGRLSGQRGRLKLHYLDAAGQAQRSDLLLDARQAPLTGPVPQTWAAYQIEAWSLDAQAHAQQIRRTSERFGLVSAQTSLIVLEDLQDYLDYDIAPPAELRAEYAQAQAELREEQDQAHRERLEWLEEAFADRVAWWEHRWPKGSPPPPKQVAGDARSREEYARAPGSAAPAPIADAPVSAGELNAIQVQGSTATTLDSVMMVGADPSISVTLQPWQPDSPYARRLRAVDGKRAYALYLDEREDYRNSTAFYLDVADVLFEKGEHALALRVLSNLAELGLEDSALLRVLAFRLNQAGEAGLAVPVLRRVLAMAEEEPQSQRDLGLALAASGQRQAAVDALSEVVRGDWDEDRFGGITLTALGELNAIVATSPTPLDTPRIPPQLQRNLPVDLRVVLSWDTGDSDMDLWVTDPNGERSFYGHPDTWQGGHMSEDFTEGYGPEEFLLRQAKPGKYKVEVNFFGERQALLTGATSLEVKLIRHFGTRREQVTPIVLRLKESKETIFVGEFEVK